jgi:hypothetical protein
VRKSTFSGGFRSDVLKNPPVFHSGSACGIRRITAMAIPHSASITTAALAAI